VLNAEEQQVVRKRSVPTESLDIRSGGVPPPAWELRSPARQPKPRRREPWTAADVALIDEAAALIGGRGRTYGHVVVDEAQDLSPMQLRMVSRRAPGGSVTLLGDLAQASGVWAPDSWKDVVAHLATPAGWRTAELRLGYRSPADVLELAARLQAVAAPHVPQTEAVRSGRGRVRLLAAEGREAVASVVAAEAGRLAAQWASTAVIAARFDIEMLRHALAAAGLDVGDAASGRLDRRVTLIAATQAKGLEFDAVVVADPAAVVTDAPRGLRLLYVAITRPTQALSIVHAGDLPAPLVEPAHA
jgi:DNA helicase IV